MTKNFLLPTIIALLFCTPNHAQTVVTAPEAPFGFEPLEMYDFPSREFPITRYGAKAGDVQATTKAFSRAMEACNKAGGGRVTVPAGEWPCGPIHFKSNCLLYLSEGAVLVFEDDPQLYLPAVPTSWEGIECMNYSPLVYAYECENVGIAGPGTLAPKMEFWKGWFARPENHIQASRQLYAMCSTGVPVEHRRMEEIGADMRPQLIQFNRCRNVTLNGFSIRESPFWTIHVYMCSDVWASGLDVYAHGHNNDGIDIEMSDHVLVEDCVFDQGDDAVVIKAGRNQDAWRLAKPTENVVIRNCTVVKAHCLLGIGSEMSAGVRNVHIHDCHTTDSVFRLFYIKTNHRRGGFVENISVENVSAASALRIFEIDCDVMYQWRDIVPTFETAVSRIRNISIRNAECGTTEAMYELRGDSRDPISGVTIENMHAGKVTGFINNTEYVRDISISGLSWDLGPGEEEAKAYLFSYFVGQSDGLHLAWSRDGYRWTPFADNSSLLSPAIGSDRLMRDPSICQGPDGTFHMVWTTSWTDRIIGYASSPDLIHWSEQRALPVMMHESDAHNCWAPEIFYDSDSGLFYIFWATTIPGRHSEVETSESEKGLNHRIYFTTTADFEEFSPTAMFFDPGFSVIDAAIARDPATGEYIMVVKNENSMPAEKNLRTTTCSRLSDGFPAEVSEPIHGDYWAEGPSPLFLEDGSLIVYFDRYREHRYGAAISRDHGRTWSEVPDEELSFPKGIRHGTAFSVDAAVLDSLLSYYGE